MSRRSLELPADSNLTNGKESTPIATELFVVLIAQPVEDSRVDKRCPRLVTSRRKRLATFFPTASKRCLSPVKEILSYFS